MGESLTSPHIAIRNSLFLFSGTDRFSTERGAIHALLRQAHDVRDASRRRVQVD